MSFPLIPLASGVSEYFLNLFLNFHCTPKLMIAIAINNIIPIIAPNKFVPKLLSTLQIMYRCKNTVFWMQILPVFVNFLSFLLDCSFVLEKHLFCYLCNDINIINGFTTFNIHYHHSGAATGLLYR